MLAVWTASGVYDFVASSTFQKEEAEATRRDMMDTLWHFVGLEVRIDRIARALADAEETRLAIAHPRPPAN